MKNKYGFSLLELLFSILIGGILLTGIFSTLYQVSVVQARIETITSVHQQAAIVFNHLERDIMGAFIPEQVDPVWVKKKDNDKEEEQKAKPIEKVFWGAARDDKNMQQFTCITSNPLEVYSGAKNSKPKPRVARVVYRLDPQKGVKNSFVLSRQEGADLSYSLYQKQADKKNAPTIFSMIDNIASLSFVYGSVESKKEQEIADDQKKRYKKSNKWNSDRKPKDDNKSKGISYALPEFVEIKLELWDIAHEKKHAFSYTIPIMFKKGKPKRKNQTPAQRPMHIAKNKKNKPPAFATAANGNKITITRDAQGKIVMTEVPV